ncbi:MAG: hypothetical protein HPY70_12770 [Firmicutes bacterium]|nr:hypothetical protein [Bacillota bacterium]
MGDYNEELKRYCMMLAVKQREEEEEEMRRSLASMSYRKEEETGNPGAGLLMLLAMGGVLWVIDKVDRTLTKFMKAPLISEYVEPFLTTENVVWIFIIGLIVRYMYMRGGGDGRIKERS